MRHDELTKFDYETNKKEIFDTIVSQIGLAAKTNEPRIYIKKLKIIDEEIDVIAMADDWSNCLTKALNFYKQIEDYESCSTCQKLIDKIEKSNKKQKTNGRKKN
jgi:hypothetical protein